MKRNRVISIITVAVCLCLMSVTTFAAEERRASDQIVRYDMKVTTGTDYIDVYFSIDGNGLMNGIGCESIKIYEKEGTSWELIESRDEDDTGMSRSNGLSYANTISFDGEEDIEYRVKVTVFAENDAGRDTRSKTFYVTGR